MWVLEDLLVLRHMGTNAQASVPMTNSTLEIFLQQQVDDANRPRATKKFLHVYVQTMIEIQMPCKVATKKALHQRAQKPPLEVKYDVLF
jgi:hypothetical protein